MCLDFTVFLCVGQKFEHYFFLPFLFFPFVSVELLLIVVFFCLFVFLIYVVNEGRISISKVLYVRVAAVFVDDTILIASEEQFTTITLIS